MNLPFDLERDLTGVSLLNYSPIIIAGRKSLPANSLAELLTWMRTAADIKFAHGGIGNVGHLCATLLADTIGVSVNMIPYRGGAQLMQDFIGEHFDLACPTAQFALEPIRAGAIKAFAVTSRDTYDPLPQIPSAVQMGMSNLEIQYWHGLFAPAGTPWHVIAKVSAAVQGVLADARTAQTWIANGILLYPEQAQTPWAATELMRSEVVRWGKVIRHHKMEARP